LEIDFGKNRAVLDPEFATPATPPLRDDWLRSIYLGWSPAYRDDQVSSSGGVLRALIDRALKTGTPVLCLAKDPAAERFIPRLLTEPHQIAEIPGSIYHSTSFVGAIDLIRQASAPVLLVAIPCQLAGVLSYIRKNEPRLAAKIQLVCGIVCGWMYSYHALQAFARAKRIRQADFGTTTYRGNGRVGELKIGPARAKQNYPRRDFATLQQAADYRSSFSTDYNRLRCRLCEDHLNMGADLITGDAWLERSASQKTSIIGCRTARGEQAVLNLAKLGLLNLERASFDDFIESQSRNLAYGTEAKQMNKILRSQGKVTPNFKFKDADNPVRVTIRQRLRLSAEVTRRQVVRAGFYTSYRWYYYFRRFRTLLRSLRKPASPPL
jgi:coenzyme F420-reducing hydrogenase beta subunit